MSDGSYHPQLKAGTSAWWIKTEDGQLQFGGNNIVPGQAADQCSHCSELCGLIGAIHHVNTLCAKHNITTGSVELGCDRLEAYKVAL